MLREQTSTQMGDQTEVCDSDMSLRTSANASNHLINLPVDILSLIINQLKVLDPLFTPVYPTKEATDSSGDLENKCTTYYGVRDQSQTESCWGLLNWSSTCHHFRKLIAPQLFTTVVLRRKPKSLASVAALAQTPYWNVVTSFIFAGDYDEKIQPLEKPKGQTQEQYVERLMKAHRDKVKADMDELSSVLSNLPPNLTQLTLDFPQSWAEEIDYENLMDCDYFENGHLEGDFEGAEGEQHYRALLKTTFETVSKYDISAKPEFELKLFNVPPYRCSAWEQPSFHNFLRHVTSFTMSMLHYDNGAGWNMNTMALVPCFGEGLPKWFFNHLDRATTFNLHGDASWPLGLAPGMNHIPLPLPSTTDHLSQIREVSLQQVFISPELVAFLTSHAQTLTSITLTDCFAHSEGGLTEVQDPPLWGDMFDALVDADPPPTNLRHISVTNPSEKLKKLIEGYRPSEQKEPQRNELMAILDKQREDEAEAYKNGAARADVLRRRRLVLPHCYLDDKYGMVFGDEDMNVDRFLLGEDYRKYLRLVELVEENIRRVDGVA